MADDVDMEVAEVTDSEEERNREAEEAGIENLQSKLFTSNFRKYFFSRRTDCLRNDLNTVDMPLKNKTMIFFPSTGKSTKYNLVVDHERFCTLQQHLLYIFKNFRPKKSKPQG